MSIGHRGSQQAIDKDLSDVLANHDIAPGQAPSAGTVSAANVWTVMEDEGDTAEALINDTQNTITRVLIILTLTTLQMTTYKCYSLTGSQQKRLFSLHRRTGKVHHS